jgi:protein gp37
VVDRPENREDPFAVRLWPERLPDPLLEPVPRRIFVNSMSDLFHADIPEPYVREVFQVMLDASWHVFQVLTKRPGRAQRFWRRNQDLFPEGRLPGHIWIGTSLENQSVAYRADQLRTVPAEVRFLSCEPLIGPLSVDLTALHWVIVGGESGPVRRPMEMEWVRSIRDDCAAAGVPFFFKQVGGRTPKAGGRLLDGRTWDEYPVHAFA